MSEEAIRTAVAASFAKHLGIPLSFSDYRSGSFDLGTMLMMTNSLVFFFFFFFLSLSSQTCLHCFFEAPLPKSSSLSAGFAAG